MEENFFKGLTPQGTEEFMHGLVASALKEQTQSEPESSRSQSQSEPSQKQDTNNTAESNTDESPLAKIITSIKRKQREEVDAALKHQTQSQSKSIQEPDIDETTETSTKKPSLKDAFASIARSRNEVTTSNQTNGNQYSGKKAFTKENGQRETLMAASAPKSTKTKLEAVGEAMQKASSFPYHVHDTRCILIITPNDELKNKDPGYITGRRFGRMSDQEEGFFLTVKYRVEYREGDIPKQDHVNESKDSKKRSPEGKCQIWPAYLTFDITLNQGHGRKSVTEVEVDPLQHWLISIPAANIKSNRQWGMPEEQAQEANSEKKGSFVSGSRSCTRTCPDQQEI